MKPKNKINLSIAIIVVLFILTTVFVISPLYGGIKKNFQELVSQKESLALLEVKINSLEKFKILYKELEEILKQIDNLFVDPEVPVEFISFLEKRAEESQLEIKISPTSAAKTPKDPWSYLAFQINSTGYFPNFLSFLEKMENSPYLIEIQNLNIGRIDEEGNVRSTFSIKVYTKQK
jgi:hypothetical protein